MNRLVIIGASGHGKVIADIAKLNGYEDMIFLDDDDKIKLCMKYPVLGKVSEVKRFEEDDFFVAIGDAKTRRMIQEKLSKDNLKIVTLIHPNAVVAEDVRIGTGTVVMAGTVINSDTMVGDGCIINTGATVDHDCEIKDYVHVSVGVHVAGAVHIGENTWIGAGAVVSNNIEICKDCMIGVGAVVVKDIEEQGTYIGIPARPIHLKKSGG